MNVIISTEPLIGMSRTSDALGRHYGSIFKDETKAKILLAQLQGLGLKTFLCPNHPQLLKLLGSLNSAGNFEIYPILLNAAEYSRDIQQYGMIGFARTQLSSLKIRNLPRIAFIGMRYLPQILMRDFRYASLLLASLEMAKFGAFHPRAVFLHPQMTDLALANGNEEFFRLFVSLVHDKCKAEAGLMTNNIGVLLEKLDKWDIDIVHIAGPVNRRGYHMKPNQAKCEELIAKARRAIIATEVNSVTIPTEDDLTYLKRLNVSSFVAELGNILDAIKLMDLLEKLP